MSTYRTHRTRNRFGHSNRRRVVIFQRFRDELQPGEIKASPVKDGEVKPFMLACLHYGAMPDVDTAWLRFKPVAFPEAFGGNS